MTPQPIVVMVFTSTGDLGFEPRLTDPESVVLPLHQSPLTRCHISTCVNRSRRLDFALQLMLQLLHSCSVVRDVATAPDRRTQQHHDEETLPCPQTILTTQFP